MGTPKGFTLVELMIVVVVVGLLAAIAIPNYLASESRAREASVKSRRARCRSRSTPLSSASDSRWAPSA